MKDFNTLIDELAEKKEPIPRELFLKALETLAYYSDSGNAATRAITEIHAELEELAE